MDGGRDVPNFVPVRAMWDPFHCTASRGLSGFILKNKNANQQIWLNLGKKVLKSILWKGNIFVLSG